MFKIFSIKRLVLIPCLILTGFLLFLPGFVNAAYVGEADLEAKFGFDWKAGVYDTPDSVADAAKIAEDPNKLALDFAPGGRYFRATGPNLAVAKAKAPNGEEIHVVKVISGSMRGYVVDYQAFKAGKGRLLAVGKTVDDANLVTAAGNGAPLTMDARGTTGEFEQTLGDRIIGGDPYDGAISSELIFAQMVSIFFVSIATIVYLIIDIVLLGRWVILIILAVISPLPFILMILPATQKYARMWWQKFMKWAFVGVLITFFLWLVPQVLATKEGGYWEARDIETFMPPGAAAANWIVTGETGGDTTDVKVIYPKFLGGDNSGADFVEGFIMFSVAVGFMIAAAWVSVTLGETAGKVALGTAKLLGQGAKKFGGYNVAKRHVGAYLGLRKGEKEGRARRRAAAAGMFMDRLKPGKKAAERVEGYQAQRLKEAEDRIKGTKPEDSLRYALAGRGPDGRSLDNYETVAHYRNAASEVENYTQYQQALRSLRKAGASDRQIAEFEGKVNPYARVDLSTPQGQRELTENLRTGKVKIDDLARTRAVEDERVMRIVGREFGNKGIEKMVTPYNKSVIENTLKETIEGGDRTLPAGVREAYANMSRDIDLAFSDHSTPDRVLVENTLNDYVAKTAPENFAKLDISDRVAEKVSERLSVGQLDELARSNKESFGRIAGLIRSKVNTAEVGGVDNLSTANSGFSKEVINYIKNNKITFSSQ